MTKSLRRPTILFLLIVAIFLFLQLFRLPVTPILFEGDHSVHISNAYRMLLGEVAFKDFFVLTFPGTETYYLILFNIFGVEQWLLNATIFCLLMGLSGLGLFFSRRVLTGWAVYLPVSIFLVVGFRILGIDGSHRFFSVLAVLTAIAIVFSHRTFWRLALAGFFCGLASSFTQPRGLMGFAAIVAFLIIEKFYTKQSFPDLLKSILWVAVPFALVIGFILIYFITTAGFETFYFDTFVFPIKHYPADSWNNFNAYLKDIPVSGNQSFFAYIKLAAPILFFYFLIPATYIIFAVVFVIKRRTLSDEKKLQLIFLNLVGLFLTVGIFSAPSGGRLYQISIPALILLIWIAQTIIPSQKIMPLLLSGLGLLGGLYSVQRQIAPAYSLGTPTGTISFLSVEAMARYQWAAEHTEPLDYLYEPNHPSLYAIFRLRNPTPMGLIRPNNYTTDTQVKEVIAGLEKNTPRYIIWNGAWDKEPLRSSQNNHLQPLTDYVESNYHFSEKLSDYIEPNPESQYKVEIWEKINFSQK